MLVFEGGGRWWWWIQHATLENECSCSFSRVVGGAGAGKPSLKMSIQGGWVVGGTGGGMQHATLENERACLFSRVMDLLYRLVNNIEIMKSNWRTLYYHTVTDRNYTYH